LQIDLMDGTALLSSRAGMPVKHGPVPSAAIGREEEVIVELTYK
jgi:hypothetical protein